MCVLPAALLRLLVRQVSGQRPVCEKGDLLAQSSVYRAFAINLKPLSNSAWLFECVFTL